MRLTKQEDNLLKWIGLLISGNYKQGKGALYNPSTKCYCAAGLAAKAIGVPRFGKWFFFGAGDVTDLYIPGKWFRKHFNFSSGAACRAMTMNDFDGKSFVQVAKFLVQFLPDRCHDLVIWDVYRALAREELAAELKQERLREQPHHPPIEEDFWW